MDYATFKVIWWVILGVVLAGYAIMDGFDLGVATLLPFVAKTDTEKRMMLNSIGPFWEGNQVWLITGGGVIFAAWPYIYATSFSGFYFAMVLLLLALILRPAAFKARSRQPHFGWRTSWDYIHFLTGLVPALVAGVAIGNVILGVPFHFDHETLQLTYTGTFFALFRPFCLLTGLISVSMIVRHGAIFTAMKVEEPVASRAITVASWANMVMIVLVICASVWAYHLNGYVITSDIDHNAYASPLNKTVAVVKGAYTSVGWHLVFPIAAIVFSFVSVMFAKARKMLTSFITSSVSIFCIISTAGAAMFPFLMPSSSNPNESLTVWDAGSSFLTLKLMLLVTVCVLPIILGYTIWVYVKMRGKIFAALFNVPDQNDNRNGHHLY